MRWGPRAWTTSYSIIRRCHAHTVDDFTWIGLPVTLNNRKLVTERGVIIISVTICWRSYDAVVMNVGGMVGHLLVSDQPEQQ
jgi:hypothetical protein